MDAFKAIGRFSRTTPLHYAVIISKMLVLVLCWLLANAARTGVHVICNININILLTQKDLDIGSHRIPKVGTIKK